jgi:anaerobic magnesium-protoporphyrin IX monomethyl ester cyclase
VLIVTGGLVTMRERSFVRAVQRQLASHRASRGGWLDLQIKLRIGEELMAQQAFLRGRELRRKPYRDAALGYFGSDRTFDTPELTEVVLMTLLAAEGIEYEAATYAELHADPGRRERLLDACDVVFASTTLLRDLSELAPLIAMLRRPGNEPANKIVCGGALASLVQADLGRVSDRNDRAGAAGAPSAADIDGIDVWAVGHGELLVPALAAWMRSGYRELAPPPGGRVEQRCASAARSGVTVLWSGQPPGHSLDALPRPDWSLAERYHGRRMPMVFYESVRGCPYRCSFCNYPYLFDDTRFRYKSAERIAGDWASYAAGGAEYVTCLDSLFTMPRQRLVALCEQLIARDVRIRWVCYARADDLSDIDVCRLMRRAGCIQVQIGIESGNQGQLDRMNKRATVTQGLRALANCHETGITTFISLILGYPGETEATLRDSLDFVREARPDFVYLSPFMTRIESVPVLSEASRKRFGLVTAGGLGSSAPYWRHDTMCSSELAGRWSTFMRAVIRERCALDGGLFYRGMLGYQRGRDRDALLAFQRDCLDALSGMRRLLAPVHAYVQRRVDADVLAQLGRSPVPPRSASPSRSRHPLHPHSAVPAPAGGPPAVPDRPGAVEPSMHSCPALPRRQS